MNIVKNATSHVITVVLQKLNDMTKVSAKQIRIGLKGGGKTGQVISGNNPTPSSRQIPTDQRGKGNSLFLFKRNSPIII